MSKARLASCAAVLAMLLAPAAYAQEAKQAARSIPMVEQRVDAFIGRLDAARKEQGVVGAVIVVADGDRVVRVAGLGARNLATDAPVTEDTLFAIGSVTKQFTAAAVALTVSDGKMSFEDHPRRFVPSFRLQDPEADAKLNMIDLLAHRSGLDRSDFPWIMAPFTPDELFQLAYRAKPVAKLREQFLYNATMYALAGAAVARAQGTTYERFMMERLLKPLGMVSSTLTLDGLTTAPNRAIGYARSTTGAPAVVKPIDLASIAPGGALNSTGRDMGAWLKFLNSGGRIDGEARIAPAAFAQLFERHQAIVPGFDHGLGFFLDARHGMLIAEHGGNVPGYTAKLVYLPERRLSFALLTNQDTSQLGDTAQALFMEVVVEPERPAPPSPPAAAPKGPAPEAASATKAPAQPIAPEELVGQYFATRGGGFEVRKGATGLVAIFPQQPPYPLTAAGVNAFNLSGLTGFSITFAKSAEVLPGRITAFLRQPPSHPGGNIPYLKRDDQWLARVKAEYGGPGKEIVGLYRSGDLAMTMEIVPFGSGVALIITGDPPHPLKDLGADLYQLEGLPETFQVRLKRSPSGQVAGLTYEQPNVRVEMAVATSASIGGEQEARAILDKAVAAAGGATALDRIATITLIGRAAALTHGLDGYVEDVIMPGKRASLMELGAFGKTVFKLRVLTNAQRSLIVLRDGEQVSETGKALRSSQFIAVPHPLYRWKERFATVAAAGETRVNGEDAFVIELTPRELAPTRLYISKESFLIVREDHPNYTVDELQPAPLSIDYSDYRVVGGVRLPHSESFAAPLLGRFTLNYDSIWLDKAIDPKVFDSPP